MRIPQNVLSPYDSTSLITHLSGSTITPCVCAHIVSEIDSTVIGITSASSDLTGVPGYPGVTFKSTSGITSSKAEHPSGTSPANMEADLFLITAGITEADVLAGKWNHAACTIFICNYEAVNMGQLIINKGHLAEFRQMGKMLTTEVRGINQALQQQIGKVTKPLCDADLGDARCGLTITPQTGTLTSVTSQRVFADSTRTQGTAFYTNGKFRFTSGQNSGFEFQVDTWDSATKTWTLRTAAPYLPQVGDSYSAMQGCQKRFEADCIAVFNNAINFRNFPHMPTLESLQKLPAQ